MHGTALVVALALAVLHGQRTEASWDLVWSDEFNIPSIDASKWSVKHNLSHCCPEELQLYMSDDVFVENGHLVLRTRRRKALVCTLIFLSSICLTIDYSSAPL